MLIDPNKLYTADEIAAIIGCDSHEIHVWAINRMLRIGQRGSYYGRHKYYGRDLILCMSHRRGYKKWLKDNHIEVPKEEEFLDGKIEDLERKLSILETQYVKKKESLQYTEKCIKEVKKQLKSLKK